MIGFKGVVVMWGSFPRPAFVAAGGGRGMSLEVRSEGHPSAVHRFALRCVAGVFGGEEGGFASPVR
jgi:hypothetical protein